MGVNYQTAVNAWADLLLPEGLIRNGDATITTSVDYGNDCPTCDMGPEFCVELKIPTEPWIRSSYDFKPILPPPGSATWRHRHTWVVRWEDDDLDFAILMQRLIAAADRIAGE